MMKFFIAATLFSFQIVLPMELAQFHHKSSLPKLPEVNFALLRFDQINMWFVARSAVCQHAVKERLSPHMLVLYEVAMLVEDARKHIVFLMFDGRKENQGAVEEFCAQLPIGQALQRYHEVKKGLGTSDKPMGPLYTMSQVKRDFVLQVLNPWYYSYPFVAVAPQAKIDEIDEEMKQYLDGITISSLSYGREQDYKICTLASCGMPMITKGALVEGGVICGVTCVQLSPSCICKIPLLSIIFRISGCVGGGMGNQLGFNLCCKPLRHSPKKTL